VLRDAGSAAIGAGTLLDRELRNRHGTVDGCAGALALIAVAERAAAVSGRHGRRARTLRAGDDVRSGANPLVEKAELAGATQRVDPGVGRSVSGRSALLIADVWWIIRRRARAVMLRASVVQEFRGRWN